MKLLKKFRYLVLIFPLGLYAQMEEESAEELLPSGTDSIVESTPSFATEKAELLQILKTDIEPNLLPADSKKIRRNVMRLGSFNERWSGEAEDFLVANAPLVELFAYDYSRIQNQRLNKKILETLVQFENYQYPRAPLVFSKELLNNTGGIDLYLRVVTRVVRLNPSVFNDYFKWVYSSEARGLSSSQRAQFLLEACRAGASFPLDLRSQVDQWADQDQDLWTSIFLEEVRACLKGL